LKLTDYYTNAVKLNNATNQYKLLMLPEQQDYTTMITVNPALEFKFGFNRSMAPGVQLYTTGELTAPSTLTELQTNISLLKLRQARERSLGVGIGTRDAESAQARGVTH
jgi:hypothetical protein